jgi:hypothetical protein
MKPAPDQAPGARLIPLTKLDFGRTTRRRRARFPYDARYGALKPISTPLGGYEMWSSWIRNPLQWLDRADPCGSMQQLYEGDPAREAHEAVVLAWRDAITIGTEVHAQQIIDRSNLIQELRTALLVVAEERNSRGFINAKRLGRWLTKVEGKICHNLRIVRAGKYLGHTLWKLATA